MTVEELKKAVESYRETLKQIGGGVVTWSSSGPIGIGIIDSLVEALESLDERIGELERGPRA